MSKWCDTLMMKLKEECKDVVSYIELSEEADEADDEYAAAKLKSMAYDEYTHAYALCSILKHKGRELDPETSEHWAKAKKAFKEL